MSNRITISRDSRWHEVFAGLMDDEARLVITGHHMGHRITRIAVVGGKVNGFSVWIESKLLRFQCAMNEPQNL